MLVYLSLQKYLVILILPHPILLLAHHFFISCSRRQLHRTPSRWFLVALFAAPLLLVQQDQRYTSARSMPLKSTSCTGKTTTNNIMNESVLPKLKSIFPHLQSIETFGTVTQANAEGYKLQLHYNTSEDDADGSCTDQPSRIFVKVVEASHYLATKKDWPDLRRTLMYARTEARFYQHFAAQVSSAPTCYHADYALHDWIDEQEKPTDPASDPKLDPRTLPNPEHKGGLIVLEYISPETHFQDSPLTIEQCKQCLEAIAELHASAWQQTPLLTQASEQLSKASFHLSTRNAKELDGLEEAWDHFLTHFQKHLQDAGLWTDSVRKLGARTKALASTVSRLVSPAPSDPYATLVHGDYKSMNVFLPRGPTEKAVLVDFASIGVGLGMSDLAMHLHHAVRPRDLDSGGEELLIQHYLDALRRRITAEYPDKTAIKHYELACVDYFRFFLGRFWKNATPGTMEKKNDSKNTNLINRSPEAAVAFVRRIDRFVHNIESSI